MPKYIVAFPNDWYLRNAVATGDRERATRFNTPEEARRALQTARDYFKKTARDKAIIEEVVQ